MYLAKEGGKGRAERFQPGMQATIARRFALKADLARALDEGQFVLAYQPIANIGTDRLVGVEALVRWHHPTRGVIPPLEFISVAEQTGIMEPLGRWILETACRQMRIWLDAGAPTDTHMSVNVSPRQLAHPEFAADVRGILVRTNLPPRNLILEITEGVLLDPDIALSVLVQLKALGLRIAIDDFGTGYSAMSYLARFPIDILKIDRSFVNAIGREAHGDSVVQTILSLARSFNLETIAEGIEDGDQLKALQQLGCVFGQGFLLGHPVDADELGRRLLRPARRCYAETRRCQRWSRPSPHPWQRPTAWGEPRALPAGEGLLSVTRLEDVPLDDLDAARGLRQGCPPLPRPHRSGAMADARARHHAVHDDAVEGAIPATTPHGRDVVVAAAPHLAHSRGDVDVEVDGIDGRPSNVLVAPDAGLLHHQAAHGLDRADPRLGAGIDHACDPLLTRGLDPRGPGHHPGRRCRDQQARDDECDDEALHVCPPSPRCGRGVRAGGSRQWLGAVPAAGVWAARLYLPRIGQSPSRLPMVSRGISHEATTATARADHLGNGRSGGHRGSTARSIMALMEVAPGVHKVEGLRVGNAYIVLAPDGLVCVDTGIRGNARHILRLVERLGHPPHEVRLIVLTHWHIDHVGSAAELKRLTGAQVAIHELDPPVKPPAFITRSAFTSYQHDLQKRAEYLASALWTKSRRQKSLTGSAQ